MTFEHQARLRRGRGASRGAFSLIELLTVLSIVAILGAMVAPRYGSVSHAYRLDLASRRVAADFSLAQSRARQRSATQTVVFNVAGGIYQLPSEPGIERKTATYSVALGAAPYAVAVGTASFGGASTLAFNGFGVPFQSGFVTLISGGAARTISVAPGSGSVTVQ